MDDTEDYLKTIRYDDEHSGDYATLKVEYYKNNNQQGIVELYSRNSDDGLYTCETTITFSNKEAKEVVDELRNFRIFLSEYFTNLGQLDLLKNDPTFAEIIKKSKDLDYYIIDYFFFPKVSRNQFSQDMFYFADYNHGKDNYGEEPQVNILSYYLEKFLKSYDISYEKKYIPIHQGYYED